MYTQILCTKKCLYQKNGRCIRNSVLDYPIRLSTNKECIFFTQAEACVKTEQNNFWSDISQNLFLLVL